MSSSHLACTARQITVICWPATILLLLALQVGVPYLEYDNSVKARTALSSAKSAMTILTEENRMLAERLAEVEAEKAEIVETLRRKHGGRSVTSSGAGVASC